MHSVMEEIQKITLRKAKRTSTSQVFLGGVEASSCSPTMVQNNRELALELNKAKSRIKELEEKGFSSKAEHFLLMEKYSLLDAQLQRMRDEQQTINIDAGELKKFCRHLRPTLDKALEKLLQSSEFLDEAYKSVSQFLQTIDWRDGDNHRDFSPKYGEPLKTPCDKDESSQMSREAALSLTRLTPSPSSSSSSDNSEMASSHHDDVSTCCTSTPLEGSYDDRRTISEPLNTSLADVSFHLILDSPPDKRSVNSMDFSGDTKQTDMDTDCSLLDSYDINPITTSPDFSVIKEEKFTKHRLESTPEEGEIKRFAADSSASNTSPSATLLCVGRRTSKRRSTIDEFTSYKEPSIHKKLRQGDPFTDCSLFQPSQHKLNFAGKRKNYEEK
ncbi:uncharacterized protein LOC124438749 [Xenia sp. Carnegie-2017]|uniref:uncharacterized protein LOC124438749 n=1 Tax=Xenia sp. Carnegie-2017 TaxID=2897299 RepID=UPI001F03EB89|nr:uncharacterized protein LOC124438749 [Xenia sp. Carnegie-2017]